MIIQSRNVLTAMITQQMNQRLSFARYIRVVMNGNTKDQFSLQDNYFALKCKHQITYDQLYDISLKELYDRCTTLNIQQISHRQLALV